MTRSRLTAGLLTVLVAAAGGCSTRPSKGVNSGGGATKATEDPWAEAVGTLRKQTDVAACRQALAQLNAGLAANPDPKFQPDPLAPAAEPALRDLLKLSDADLLTLNGASFAPIDGHYLAECFYLRDAARSLDVGGLPPARQAEAAFAWVCRQVVLSPWVSADLRTKQKTYMPPVPPAYALRRGSGSGLERGMVFLSLLQQLGLDGCFVGPPDAAGKTWGEGATADRPPPGPFWAVGVRVGPDVLLFDPFRGEPVPGPGGQGIGTLAQVKATPDLLKPWRDDKARPWDVPAETVAKSVPITACPLPAVAPRMKRLEAELKDFTPVRLAVDPVAVRQRFVTEAKQPDARFWAAPGDLFGTLRLLSGFLPPDEGGAAPVPDLINRYRADLIPRSVFAAAVPPGLITRADDPDPGAPEAADRLRLEALTAFAVAFLTDPPPRERTQRGQFDEVTRVMVERRREFAAGLERLRTDAGREKTVAEFVKKVKAAYTKLSVTRDRRPAEAAAVQEEVDDLWKRETPAVRMLVDTAVSQAGMAEATYLLAGCKHEQAERVQARADRLTADPSKKPAADAARADAVQAWREARDWWERYRPYAAEQDRYYPGRAAHADRLAARAAARAGG